MKTIHKYPLRVQAPQTIHMRKGAEILCVQVQDEELFLWALVDSTIGMVSFRVDVIGTGGTANYSRKAYVGTVQERGFVWHVFAWPEAV
jgi:hypothetical protein